MRYSTDHSVGLDQVLIQLQEVVPHWRDLAEAMGMDMESLKRIQSHVWRWRVDSNTLCCLCPHCCL